MTAEVHAYVTGEQAMIKHLLESSGSLRRRQQQAVALAQRAVPQLALPAPHPGTEQFLMKVAKQVMLTAATHQLSSNTLRFNANPPRPVTDEHIATAKAYTGNLLGVNLDDVEVVVVPPEDWDVQVAEGLTFYYAPDQHLVFVPSTFSAPAELLCHELGHAAHATARRRTEELPFYMGLAVTEELVAHFNQFNYILSHGSRREFLEALGALTSASFALSIWATQGAARDIEAYLRTPHAAQFQTVVASHDLSYQFVQFATYDHLYVGQIHRAVAMLLALLLLDEHEGMRRFIALDRVDHSLADKLAAAFPNVDLDAGLAGINERIAALAARCAA